MSPVVLKAASGAILGIFAWIAYRQLIAIDPFDGRWVNGHLAAAVIGGALGATRLRAALWTVCGLVAAAVMLVAYTPLIVGPARSLIRRDNPLPVDAVVVLASGLGEDELLSHSGADRVLSGVDLVRTGAAGNIVLTRVTHWLGGKELSSNTDQRRLLAALPPGTVTFVVDSVFSTRDEAMRIKPLITAKKWQRVAIVTSPSHSRRACRTFEHVGIQVICSPALDREVAFGSLRTAGDRLAAFRLWTYEMVATFEYRRRGWTD